MSDKYPFASLGARVKAIRREKKISLIQCAKLSGVSRRHLAEFEKGLNVTLLVAQKVLSVLRIEDFMLGDVLGRVAALRLDPVLILESVDSIESAIGLVAAATAMLRTATEVRATSHDEDKLTVRASELLCQFTTDLASLDLHQQVETLERLTKDRAPVTTRSRRIRA